jgi:pimeloyl-ACP methyl ester carboxylesterase
MVSDLIQLCDHMDLLRINLAGHSMGGKVAMLVAIERPELVSRLLVLDIAPKKYAHSHAPFLSEMLNIDLNSLSSRKQADEALSEAIPDTATRLFLLQSLSGSPGNYQWRLNLPVLYNYMDEIIDFPSVSSSAAVPTLVLTGAQSNYFTGEDEARLRRLFPNSRIEVISGAGHWLHAEQPQKVLAAMDKFLEE